MRVPGGLRTPEFPPSRESEGHFFEWPSHSAWHVAFGHLIWPLLFCFYFYVKLSTVCQQEKLRISLKSRKSRNKSERSPRRGYLIVNSNLACLCNDKKKREILSQTKLRVSERDTVYSSSPRTFETEPGTTEGFSDVQSFLHMSTLEKQA